MDEAKAAQVARYLDLPLDRFLSRYCYAARGRWYIGVGRDGFCHFYDHQIKGCRIHPVKPEPCRLWPFFEGIVANREGFEVARNNCPGIRDDVDYDEFVAFARRNSTDKKE